MINTDVSAVVPSKLYLRTRGPAQLRGPAGKLPLRRKALAILYYLALEGPARRERLADLLWDTSDPLANLRVELNAINGVLKPFGILLCDRYQDPLELPAKLQLDLNGPGQHEEILDGLDGLGESFQEWLDWRRSRLRAASTMRVDFDAEIDAVAGTLRAPHLLVVEPQPCETALAFAEVLAQRLRLQLLPYAATGNGLRYAAPPHPADLIRRVQAERGSIWVFERPWFGDDPLELLELRMQLHPSEITYLRLTGSSWFTEIQGRLGQVSFTDASRLYLAANGHRSYLSELVPYAQAHELPILQRYRAGIELQIRKLSSNCRPALLALAVRSRFLTKHNAVLPEVRDCLTELVEQRWLEYTDAGWRFTSSFARSIVYQLLPEGLRQASHREQAVLFEQLGRPVPALMQHLMAGDDVDPHEIRTELQDWAWEAFSREFGRPSDLQPAEAQRGTASQVENFLEKGKSYGAGVEQAGNSSALVRHDQTGTPSGVAFTLPHEPVLIQLSGQARIGNRFGIGLFGDAVPLRIRADDEVVATLAPGQPAAQSDAGLLLPLPESFSYWFRSSGSRQLSIETDCESGIVQFDVRCFGEAGTGKPVEVWALEA